MSFPALAKAPPATLPPSSLPSFDALTPSYARSGEITATPEAVSALSSETINYKGAVVALAHLEQHLAGHPLVRDCAVLATDPTALARTTASAHPAQQTPTALVALSPIGRERALQGGERESKKMKTELVKFLSDYALPLKQMKGKVAFVDSIRRCANGTVAKRDLCEKVAVSAAPPIAGPSKGFFNTVLSSPPDAVTVGINEEEGEAAPKKAGRDLKRRATHSQIERRRREKINDRLVTLRSIVPACAKELEDRRRQKQEEEEEAARIAAGGTPKLLIDAATGKPKRKRNRKKPEPKKAGDNDKDEELGLHKLEVLTHAINHIFELKARIQELETGKKPTWIPTADDPFGKGIRNEAATAVQKQDAAAFVASHPTAPVLPDTADQKSTVTSAAAASSSNHCDAKQDDDDDDDGEDEEQEDQLYAVDGRKRIAKRPTSQAARQAPLRARLSRSAALLRHQHDSSSSSRDSDETSPVMMSLGPNTPLLVSPATTVSSPMMSLSVESPIFDDMGTKRSQGPHAFQPLPPAALPLPAQSLLPPNAAAVPGMPLRRESSSFLFKQLSLTSPNFAPFNPLSYSAASRSRANAALSATTAAKPAPSAYPMLYGSESGARDPYPSQSNEMASPGEPGRSRGNRGPSGLADSDTSAAAALLLNFSTSPEVMRPVSALRSSRRPAARPSHATSSGPSTTNLASSYEAASGSANAYSSRHPLVYTSPQFRPSHSHSVASSPYHYDYSLRKIPGSAPGGAWPSNPDAFSAFPTPASSRHREDADAAKGQEGEEDGLLHSPPHLALDAAPEDDREDESSSDVTVEDLQRVPMPMLVD
ncbi:hypothetical protein ACQY0O_004759 [Thecaphora frezii]